jgi:hypothetical protein
MKAPACDPGDVYVALGAESTLHVPETAKSAGLACAEDTSFYFRVNECPARQRSFKHGAMIGEKPPLDQPKSNLRGDAYLLVARTL